MYKRQDLDHPEVVAELNRWGKWVSNELDLDGMRLDAIKHMKDQFVAQFLDTVRSERGDDFYADVYKRQPEYLTNLVFVITCLAMLLPSL